MHDEYLGPERAALKAEVQRYVASVPSSLLLEMDKEEVVYPRAFLEGAARERLLGLRFDPQYGGRGLGWVDEVVALEEMGALGSSLSCLYSLVSIVGEALHRFGTPEQKERYLSRLTSAVYTPAEGLTEPRGGSDFFGATTTAIRDGDSYILNGQKRFVVGAEGADVFLIYARTSQTAHPSQALSAFIVERDHGVQVEHIYGLMGTRGGGAGRIKFSNTRVPASNIILGEGQGSTVFHQMMIPERLTTAAGALGMARSALEIAASYADKRRAFGKKIREFQAVSFKIADSITLLDAARAMVHYTADAVDKIGGSGHTRRLVSQAKKFSTESTWTVVNNAMQILGGIGYTDVYPVERMLRDSRIMSIWTGTNEIMDLIIQHEYMKEHAKPSPTARDVEADAIHASSEEKVYE